jgi:hypothetical protein
VARQPHSLYDDITRMSVHVDAVSGNVDDETTAWGSFGLFHNLHTLILCDVNAADPNYPRTLPFDYGPVKLQIREKISTFDGRIHWCVEFVSCALDMETFAQELQIEDLIAEMTWR